MKEKIQKIETIYHSVLPLLKKAINAEDIKQVEKHIELLKNPAATILICGEFKRGKSSFVNALIGRNICPVDQDICTAVVTVIRYGEKEKAVRYYGSFENLKKEIIKFENIIDYSRGRAENMDNTVFIEVFLPLERLKQGLTIIDSPGVGGTDPRHAFITTFFMPQADITLFMTDVNEPLTTTELDFFKDKVCRYSNHNAVILNKTDLKSVERVAEIKKDSAEKIARYCGIKPLDINVIPVSSKHKLDYMKFNEEEDLESSNFNAVEQIIEQLLYNFRQAKLINTRDEMLEQIRLIVEPLRIQLNQIVKPDPNLSVELQNRQKELQRQIKNLNDPASDFRAALQARVAEERESVVNHLNEQSILFSKNGLANLLKMPEAQGENGSDWVVKNLNAAVQSLGAEVMLELDMAFERIATMPEFQGMLQYNVNNFAYEIKSGEFAVNIPIHKRLMSMLPGMGVGFATNLVAGGIIGFLGLSVGAFVVPALAVGAGLATALKCESDAAKNAKIAEFNNQYQPQIGAAMSQLRTFVDTQFTKFQTEWLRVVSKRVENYQESMTDLIGKIKDLSQNQAKVAQRQLAIANAIRPLEAHMKTLTEIK